MSPAIENVTGLTTRYDPLRDRTSAITVLASDSVSASPVAPVLRTEIHPEEITPSCTCTLIISPEIPRLAGPYASIAIAVATYQLRLVMLDADVL